MKTLPVLLLLLPLAVLAAPEKSRKTPEPSIPRPSGSGAVATRSDAGSGELDAVLRARIDSCFIFMKEGKVTEAYQKLFESSSMAKDQPELMEELSAQTTRVLQKCGKVESSSIIRIRSAGKTLREVICMVNCQKRPLRYIIYAYYAEGRWQVIDTKVDADLDSFFPRD